MSLNYCCLGPQFLRHIYHNKVTLLNKKPQTLDLIFIANKSLAFTFCPSTKFAEKQQILQLFWASLEVHTGHCPGHL